MDAIETIEKDGWTASLYYDTDPMKPDDWDTLATFAHDQRYTFGDSGGPIERLGWRGYIRYLTLMEGAFVLPVYLADYGSGLRCWATGAEDANACLITTHARLNELCGEDPQYHTREWVAEALKSELETWSQYLEGDVYGVVVTGPKGEDGDSCWGFYGQEYAMQEAQSMLDASIEMERCAVEQVNRITAL